MTRQIRRRRSLACLVSLLPSVLAAQTLPDFAAADFSAPAPHALFPLEPGHSYAISGAADDDPDARERSVHTVLGPGPVILGVASVTVLDEAYDGDRLVERTMDYFANDADGNVWYLGEDVLNFRYDDAGTLTGTDAASAWRAGVNGAMPGIALPAAPVPGVALFQEHAPGDDAMDWAELVATDLTLETPRGPLAGVWQFYEASTVEADLREFKYYAPGIGVVRADEGLSPDRTDPELILLIEP